MLGMLLLYFTILRMSVVCKSLYVMTFCPVVYTQECLRRALKIADVCMASSMHVQVMLDLILCKLFFHCRMFLTLYLRVNSFSLKFWTLTSCFSSVGVHKLVLSTWLILNYAMGLFHYMYCNGWIQYQIAKRRIAISHTISFFWFSSFRAVDIHITDILRAWLTWSTNIYRIWIAHIHKQRRFTRIPFSISNRSAVKTRDTKI